MDHIHGKVYGKEKENKLPEGKVELTDLIAIDGFGYEYESIRKAKLGAYGYNRLYKSSPHQF